MPLNVVLRVLVCQRMYQESITLIAVRIYLTRKHYVLSGVSVTLQSLGFEDNRDGEYSTVESDEQI